MGVIQSDAGVKRHASRGHVELARQAHHSRGYYKSRLSFSGTLYSAASHTVLRGFIISPYRHKWNQANSGSVVADSA